MADYFPTTDVNTVKLWSRDLQRAMLAKLVITPYMGGSGNIITEQAAKGRNKGDEVKYNLRADIDGEGKVGSETLEGFEEDLTIYQDSLRIDLTRHAVFVGDEISDERHPWDDLRVEGRDALAQWGAKRLEQGVFAHLGGWTPANLQNPTRRGHNTVVAPSTTRILRANGGTNATDEAVAADTTAKMTLGLVDIAKERAFKQVGSAFPIEAPNSRKHVCFISPEQLTDLRDDDKWEAIQLAALSRSADNPLYKYAAGEYNDTIFVVSQYVTEGVHSTTGATVANCRRAVFCGAGAASVAFGRNYGGTSWKWVEKMRDYDDKRYIAAKLLFGLKSNRFNSIDFGKIVISTYAAAH